MKSNYKILYLTTTSRLCGAEKIIYELSKRINKERFEIMVCTIKDDLKGGLLDRCRDIGIKTTTLGVENKWKFYKSFQLHKIIKEFNPDILQSFLFFDNILARIFGKIASVPVIISGQRNVETERSSIRNFLDKYTFFLSDLVISNTMEGKKILLEKFHLAHPSIKVIYNGIDLQQENNSVKKKEFLKEIGLTGDEKIVGFIGRLEKQKGVQYLIEAIKILNRENPSIYTLLIGDGKEKDILERYSQYHGCKAIFLGWKENAIKYLSSFDLLVLPSLWEGMPNVVLEAMKQGIPVVATSVGGNIEIIDNGKTGFLLKPANSQLLADKIKMVLSLPESEKKLIVTNAKQNIANQFNILKMVQEFEDTYIHLLSEKGI